MNVARHGDGVDLAPATAIAVIAGAIAVLGAVHLPPALADGDLPFVPTLLLLASGTLAAIGWLRLAARRARLQAVGHMLDMVSWQGSEAVLNLGTGQGLLLAGAARRLSCGHVVGLDAAMDRGLRGRSRRYKLLHMLRLNGLHDRTTLLAGDITRTEFADETFDVVLSLMPLRSIRDDAKRVSLCREIARIVKPGGRVIVGDVGGKGRYGRAFAVAGLRFQPTPGREVRTFLPVWVVEARKL